MIVRPPRNQLKVRRAVAALELAILLPFLAFLFVICLDFGRLFYHSLTIANCARNGALWASDPVTRSQSPYATVQDAALADASSLRPALVGSNVSSASGTDANGDPFVTVTVTYAFHTITNFPGVASQWDLTRTVQMRTVPTVPSNFPP